MALPPESPLTQTTTSKSASTPAQSSTTPTSTSTSTPPSTSPTPSSSSSPSPSSSSISIVTITSTSPSSRSSSSSSSSSSLSDTVTTPAPTQILPTTNIPESTSTFTLSLQTETPTTSPASRTTNSGFFSNTRAVAGVFTVAGLVGVAVIVLVITSFLRRRRAKKFDKDTAQAAMEAAASSHRNFDDYGYPGSDISGTGYGGFSAETHGTYGQPAMSHGRDAYMMHDVNGGGGGYGAGDEYAGVAGAAGIGAAVGAVAMQRARSRRSAGVHSQEDYNGYDQTPYPAFAGPGAHLQQQMYDQPQSRSMAESTALGGAVGPFVNRRPSQPYPQAVDLARNKSQGSSGGGPLGNPPQDQRSYASHYQTVKYSDGRGEGPEDPFRRNTLLPPPVSALHNPHDAAYDGYDDLHQHVQGSDDEGPSAEERMSIREDDDYEQPRVLKVANGDSD